MTNRLATIISFCTNDTRYLAKCIEGVSPFSRQILIPICDHFYNGEAENYPLLQKIYRDFPQVEFIEFAYSTDQMYGTPAKLIPESPFWSHAWHNSSRVIGTHFLQPEMEWVLFVDADEIFSAPIDPSLFEGHSAIRWATYWYYQTAGQRATTFPDGPLLVHRDQLKHLRTLDEHERMGLFLSAEGKKLCGYLVEGKPIVHHYSWVRTEEELEKKLKTWGHHWEREWESLFRKHPAKDVVRGYSYEEAAPFWDPLLVPLHLPEKTATLKNHREIPFPNVTRVTPEIIARKELERMLL